jgi:EAL domain-containing protein (putative c-di-GMP-specific phosphodiesterase class I)
VDAVSLLRRAEVALGAAKRAKSGYAIYAAEQDHHNANRLLLSSDLQQAIANNQFILEYQPKVDVTTGRTRGVEALVRWAHPRLGRIPPDQFITLAEQTGTITALTHRVLETALSQGRDWQQMGLALNLAVNLSMRTVHDSQFPHTVASLLRRYAMAPERVTLEITESTLMVDRDGVGEALARLAGMGVRLSIDDFGTGYSSLSYLSRLPVQEIKIDRSFVGEMTTRQSAATIVRSIIELGHNLGLQVVAEGVEDRAQWSSLADWGCDVVQGYYLSPPVNAADLQRGLLTSQHGSTHVAS